MLSLRSIRRGDTCVIGAVIKGSRRIQPHPGGCERLRSCSFVALPHERGARAYTQSAKAWGRLDQCEISNFTFATGCPTVSLNRVMLRPKESYLKSGNFSCNARASPTFQPA